MKGGTPRNRRGFILFAVAVALSLLALAVPTLALMGAQSALLSRTRMDALRAHLAARSAAQVALAGWHTWDAAGLGPGERMIVLEGELGPSVAMRAEVERLDTTLYLIRGEGRVGAGGKISAEARLGHLVAAPSLQEGVDWLAGGSTGDPDPLRLPGWPAPELLGGVADHIVGEGALSLAPRKTGDACDVSASGNWGAPLDPDHSCAGYFPLIYVPDSLTVRAGAGQGILVVQGDLALEAEAHFYGVVLVAGALTLAPGARITGAVRTALQPEGAGGIAFELAAVRAAVSASTGLNRPFRPARRAWVPLF